MSRGSSYDPVRHGPQRIVGPGFHERVFRTVARIPPGRVSTYGDVAAALGRRSVARHVGNALAALPAGRTDVPWHRVLGAGGRLSPRGDGGPSPEQRARLRAEGLEVSEAGRVAGFARVRFTFGEPPPPERA